MKTQARPALGLLAIAFSITALTGCGRDDKFADQPAAPTTATVAAVAERAAVGPEGQFASSDDSAKGIDARTPSPTCSLENVITIADNSLNPGDAPNTYSVDKGKLYKLIGFATDKEAGKVPKSFRMMLLGDHVYSIKGATGAKRPDVATFFKVPGFADAGYQIDAAFDDVEPGSYRVVVLRDGQDDRACPTFQTLIVR